MRASFHPCVKCGFCCRQGACSYGRWDASRGACAFLTGDDKCSKYDEIVETEKDSAMPMFGCGCSSPMFNERRNRKIRAMYAANFQEAGV